MLSNIYSTELNSASTLALPVIYVDAMNALLSADSLELDSDDLDHSIDVEQYLRLDEEDATNRIATSNSNLTISPHESVSRRSSDEGSNTNLMSISSALTSPNSEDIVERELALTTVGSVNCEDFPFEDVLSLESALVEAVGDEIGKATDVQQQQIKDFHVKMQFLHQRENVTTETTPSQLAMALERIEVSSPSASSDSASTSYHSNVSSATVTGVISKISHRVALTPKSTVVLSDDVLRKKHRPISITSISTKKSAEYIARKSETNSSPFSKASPRSKSFGGKQQQGDTPHDSNIPNADSISSLHKKTSVQNKTFERNTAQKANSLLESVSSTKQVDTTERCDDDCHTYTRTYSEAFISDRECSNRASSTDSHVSSAESSNTQLLQKHPLPPEGYKITRYPLMKPTANVLSGDDEKVNIKILPLNINQISNNNYLNSLIGQDLLYFMIGLRLRGRIESQKSFFNKFFTETCFVFQFHLRFIFFRKSTIILF